MMAMKLLEERQEHENGIHARIPKYWERLASGSQALMKFKEEQAENLDEDMIEILKTDLAESNTILYYFALAPLESKIENSPWDKRWNAMDSLTKTSIEESMKKLLRKPIDFEIEINEEFSSDEEIAPAQIPKRREVVMWDMLSLAREDVIAAMVKENIAIFSVSALRTAGALAIIKNLREELGVVLVYKGAEEEEEVLAFKDRVNDNTDAGAETSSQSTTISDSDDDNVPLADIVRRRKAAIADKPKKRKSASTHTEPRKKTKVTSRKQTK